MASQSLNSKPKQNVYRIPKELDILPPRPVLFPWLPKNGLDCLFGPQKKMLTNERFSFDGNSGGKQGESFSQPGTPSTAPLSPSNENDDEENPIPDMSTSISRVDKKKQTRGKNHQQQNQLGNFTDVIAEVLRVIFFIISMKRAVLRQNGEEPRGKPKNASRPHQNKNQSLEGSLDIV